MQSFCKLNASGLSDSWLSTKRHKPQVWPDNDSKLWIEYNTISYPTSPAVQTII